MLPESAHFTNLPGYMLLGALRDGQGAAATARVFVQDDIDAGRLLVLHEVFGRHHRTATIWCGGRASSARPSSCSRDGSAVRRGRQSESGQLPMPSASSAIVSRAPPLTSTTSSMSTCAAPCGVVMAPILLGMYATGTSLQ